MNTPSSYEEVVKELEEVNEILDLDRSTEMVDNIEISKDFKFEYAFESVTERCTAYKRRNYDL